MSSAAKRAAAIATQREPCADASAARPATRPISVHLTGFAPGRAREPINSRRRWATFYGRTPFQVVRATLKECRLAPAAVRTETEVNGDVAVLGEVPPELLRLVSSAPGALVPFAIFWDGLSEPELQHELAALAASGWVPLSEVAA